MIEDRAQFQPFKPRVVPRAAIRLSAETTQETIHAASEAVALFSEVSDPVGSSAESPPVSAEIRDGQAALAVLQGCRVEEPVADTSAMGEPCGGHGRDPERCDAVVRERAIELAAEACAQALHLAIARNPLFVARFVDDAMRAVGAGQAKAVRLHPASASMCSVGCEIVADPTLESGEVVVDTATGSMHATIAQRADLLVRAVADR